MSNTSNTSNTPDDALKEYERLKPVREQLERQKQLKQINELAAIDLDIKKKRELEKNELKKKTEMRQQLLIKENPAGKLFESTISQIEKDDTVQTKILEHITNTGSTNITVIQSCYRGGYEINSEVGVTIPKTQFDIDEIVNQFDQNKHKWNKKITEGKFKDWTLYASVKWSLTGVFIFIVPYRQLSIQLYKPWSWFSFKKVNPDKSKL
jgi:hypothetical protein